MQEFRLWYRCDLNITAHSELLRLDPNEPPEGFDFTCLKCSLPLRIACVMASEEDLQFQPARFENHRIMKLEEVQTD